MDLTVHCSVPADLLFDVQLGGSEDYWKATCSCERFMHTPTKTLCIIIGDLHDTSANPSRFVKTMEFILQSGVKAIGLLQSRTTANLRTTKNGRRNSSPSGMPCFGCTQQRLPESLAAALKPHDRKAFAGTMKAKS